LALASAPRTSALALTGPPDLKALMPVPAPEPAEMARGMPLPTCIWSAETGPPEALAEPRPPPPVGVEVPLPVRLPRLGYRNGDSPLWEFGEAKRPPVLGDGSLDGVGVRRLGSTLSPRRLEEIESESRMCVAGPRCCIIVADEPP